MSGILQTRGATLYLGSVPGTAKAMSAITNATSAVATLEAAHGVIVGDYITITSGWALLNNRIARASAVATNDVTLEGIDTSDTAVYPPGAGAGSVQEFTWATQLSQIEPTLSPTGGDPKYLDGTFLELLEDQQFPAGFTARSWDIGYFTNTGLTWLDAVRTAMTSQALRPFMLKALNDQRVIFNAYWALNEFANITDGSFRGRIALAQQGLATSYAT